MEGGGKEGRWDGSGKGERVEEGRVGERVPAIQRGREGWISMSLFSPAIQLEQAHYHALTHCLPLLLVLV